MKVDYIKKKSKEILNKYSLDTHVKALLDYWEANNPTPGHGFLHVLTTGVNSFELGKLNKYNHPQYLFLGGLFHDIYRPAEGKHGEEDQAYGAVVVGELFQKNNFSCEIKDLIVSAIQNHDNWKESKNPPVFELLLSIGDKASHNTLLTDSYVWINNRRMEIKTEPCIYTNHLETLSSFYKYQQRAWQIFTRYKNIKGIERAIIAYMDIVTTTISRYKEDPNGDSFADLVLEQKNKTYEYEVELLKEYGRNTESIAKILHEYTI